MIENVMKSRLDREGTDYSALENCRLFTGITYCVNLRRGRNSCHEIHIWISGKKVVACNRQGVRNVRTFETNGEHTMLDLLEQSIKNLSAGDCKDRVCRDSPHTEEDIGICRRCFLHCLEMLYAQNP